MRPYGPVLAHLTLGAAPTSQRLTAFCATLEAVRFTPSPPAPERPFMLLTPLGFDSSKTLRHVLRGEGIVPHPIGALDGWPELATELYANKVDNEERALKALIYENLWRWLFPAGRTVIWGLSLPEYALLCRLKPSLRHRVANWRVRVTLPNFSFYANLHPFHVPDPEDLGREWDCIKQRVQQVCRHLPAK